MFLVTDSAQPGSGRALSLGVPRTGLTGPQTRDNARHALTCSTNIINRPLGSHTLDLCLSGWHCPLRAVERDSYSRKEQHINKLLVTPTGRDLCLMTCCWDPD